MSSRHSTRIIRRTVRAGSVLLLACSTAPRMAPAHPKQHPPLAQQQYFLQCRLESAPDPQTWSWPLEISSSSSTVHLEKLVALPGELPTLRIDTYLPHATLIQEAHVEVDAGAAAIEISIEGPTQSYRRWLLAGDPQRNRLLSYIGSWRYMAPSDAAQRDVLLAEYRTELTRVPRLHITSKDSAWTIEAEPGKKLQLQQAGCAIAVLQFYPHFGIDPQTRRPRNLSSERRNPAALVEIEMEERTEKRWVISKFPAFHMKQDDQLPVELRLDCPQESRLPDFVVITCPGDEHEIWHRQDDVVQVRRAAPGDLFEITGSQYVFRLDRFLPRARLEERYAPVAKGEGVPAISVEVRHTQQMSERLWLQLGKPRTLSTPAGSLTIWFGPRQPQDLKAHP